MPETREQRTGEQKVQVKIRGRHFYEHFMCCFKIPDVNMMMLITNLAIFWQYLGDSIRLFIFGEGRVYFGREKVNQIFPSARNLLL